MVAPLETSTEHFRLIYHAVNVHYLPALSHLILSYLKPLYFLDPYVIRSLNLKPVNILQKRVVQTFLEEGNEGKEFRSMLARILKVHNVIYTIRDLTHPLIPIPSLSALEMHTKQYREKYTIDIHVRTLASLSLFFREKGGSQMYGVILADSHCLREDGHVVSLLCAHGDYLVIDSSDENDFVKSVLTLVQQLISGTLYVTYLKTQADNHSCRTGALMMLRNILLFYKEQRSYLGIKSVLDDFEIPITKGPGQTHFRAEYIPPAWIYTEQICPQRNQSYYSVIPRDLNSKKISKRKGPKTTHIFRQLHQMHLVPQELSIELNQAAIQLLQHYALPKDVRISPSTLTFQASFYPNMYLFHKAFRNKAKLEGKEDVK